MANKTKENVHENHRQRLRDRFAQSPDSLNKHELLELLLFYAIPRKNVNPLAHTLIDKFGTINGVLSASAEDLKAVEGVGESTASFLTTVGKFIDVVSQENVGDEIKLFNLDSVKRYLIKFFSAYDKEVFLAFFLSKSNKIIAKTSYTSHKVDEINLLLSEFSRSFATLRPHAVVIAHNHPSGNPSPSPDDDSSTEKMHLMFSLSGVQFYDHVIIGGNKLYSYRADGRLEKIAKSINERFNL
ncbi:MAG: RadC family protein [Clostridia bacterium]|nr:RadC family protein [Clostridia bacterium]